MSDWHIHETSADNGLVKIVIRTDKSQAVISASQDSITPVDSSEVNWGAAKVVAGVGGLPVETQVALLRSARDGIDQLLRHLVS